VSDPDPDPIASLAAVWASIGERTGDYVAVWRRAIDRNGKGDYAAADLLQDTETLWGMTIGDAARFGVAVVDAVAPLVAGFGDHPRPKPPDPDPDGNGS
jgi:hypothetical protein